MIEASFSNSASHTHERTNAHIIIHVTSGDVGCKSSQKLKFSYKQLRISDREKKNAQNFNFASKLC